MTYRRCPNCGKSMLLSADDAGRTVLCGACGTRVAVPAGFAAADGQAEPSAQPRLMTAAGPAAADLGEGWDFAAGREPADPEAAGGAAPAGSAAGASVADASRSDRPVASSGDGDGDGHHGERRRSIRPRAAATAAAVVLSAACGLIGGWLVGGGVLGGSGGSDGSGVVDGRSRGGDGAPTAPADDSANGELVRLKSEAETLAVAGRLAEAHAKYQSLMAAAADRPPASPLMWDVVGRAKVDQDRVYRILLAQADGAESAPGTPGSPDAVGAAAGPSTDEAAIPPDPGGAGRRPLSDPDPAVPPVVPPPVATGGGPAALSGLAGTRPVPASPLTTGPAVANAPATSPAELGPVAAVPPAVATPATVPAALSAASRPTYPVAKVDGVELRPVPPDPAGFNPAALDAQVETALRRGADYLLALFANGELPPERPAYEMSRRGLHAAIVYALLSAGQAVDDPRLRPTDPRLDLMIEKLKSYRLDGPRQGAPSQPVVYARGMRAAALSVYNRPADRAVLKADVSWLVGAAWEGAYGPDDRLPKWPGGVPPPPPGGDGPPGPSQPRRSFPVAGGTSGQPSNPSRGPFPINPSGRAGGLNNPIRRNERQSGGPTAPPAPPSPRGGSGRAVPGPFELYGPSGPLRDAGPLRDVLGRPIEFAYAAERAGGGAPPAAAYLPPAVWPSNNLLPGYGPEPGAADAGWDNFNSQIGLFGVWCGAEAGVPVPPAYWRDAFDHWVDCDLGDGQWPFRAGDRTGTLAVTAGAVASLLTAYDWMAQTGITSRYGVAALPPEVAAGLDYLATGGNAVDVPNAGTRYVGFDLFALGRAGRASGYKRFGSHDWYAELAGRACSWQHPNGSWGRSPTGRAENAVETAFHLMFLAQGRHPVLMSKLRSDGAWQNRPRDLANAASYLGRATERPLNWQVVTFDEGDAGWHDAPVLYVAGEDGMRWSPAEAAKVKAYVDGGGLLFLHADKGSPGFAQWAAQFLATLYPQYPLTDLPPDHPLYTLAAKVSPANARLRGLNNGSRLLVLLSVDDLAGSWQRRTEKADSDAYRFLVNLHTFATGKTPPKSRLAAADVPPPPGTPAVTIPVARVRYAGNWDPEPGAWPRLGRYLRWEAGAGVDAKPVTAGGLSPAGGGAPAAPLAHLTGTAAFAPTPAETAALRAYVEAGGVLLVEACGGSPAFRAAAEGGPAGGGWLAAAFPGLALAPATADAPPLARSFDVQDDFLGGADVRPYVVERLGAVPAPADRLRVAAYGKGYVVYSPLDLSTGLAGSTGWGVAGYAPESAVGIVKNLLVWSAARDR